MDAGTQCSASAHIVTASLLQNEGRVPADGMTSCRLSGCLTSCARQGTG